MKRAGSEAVLAAVEETGDNSSSAKRMLGALEAGRVDVADTLLWKALDRGELWAIVVVLRCYGGW